MVILVKSEPALSLGSEYRDGQWSARHVYDACDLPPARQDLIAERMSSLRAEWPTATWGSRYELASAWADGWLSVATRERLAHELASVED